MDNRYLILNLLHETYEGAKPALIFKNAYELLVATILSAQCTDVRVNEVTKELFKKYRTASDLASADYEVLCNEIKTCGCYKIKAKNLISTSKIIRDKFSCEVPRSMDELMSLPGVGRKTANVVLSNAFHIPGIAVDTHVFRVSNRLGLANSDNVYDTEMQLRNLIPVKDWSDAHHWLIYHGRQVCKARNPGCKECFLNKLCKHNTEGEK